MIDLQRYLKSTEIKFVTSPSAFTSSIKYIQVCQPLKSTLKYPDQSRFLDFCGSEHSRNTLNELTECL